MAEGSSLQLDGYILAAIQWLRRKHKAGEAIRQSFECSDPQHSYTGHAYTLGPWFIVIAHQRKE